jgi:hypothetical protein
MARSLGPRCSGDRNRNGPCQTVPTETSEARARFVATGTGPALTNLRAGDKTRGGAAGARAERAWKYGRAGHAHALRARVTRTRSATAPVTRTRSVRAGDSLQR